MRALLLIITASAASQLPARDVPRALTGQEMTLVQAAGEHCPSHRSDKAPVLATGLTLFTPAGRIA